MIAAKLDGSSILDGELGGAWIHFAQAAANRQPGHWGFRKMALLFETRHQESTENYDFSLEIAMIIPAQIRMARAALRISIRELAEKAVVAESTILRFEAGKGGMEMRTLDSVQSVLEDGGVIFDAGTEKNGPGVYLTKNASIV